MKKYYLHNGTGPQGPFDIEDLKSKQINKDTAIWHEGLSEWTTADKVDELKELIRATTPPPFSNKQTPPVPPVNKQTMASTPVSKKENNLSRTILIFVIVLIAIVGGLNIFKNYSSAVGFETSEDTYQEKVMTVEEIERSQPTNFLTADGNYKNNFWGTKIKVYGVITNTATVATYKDAVVRVTYFSKTKTELGSKDYTIYETFPPHSTKNFELKIENYKNVHTIGWDVIQATAN